MNGTVMQRVHRALASNGDIHLSNFNVFRAAFGYHTARLTGSYAIGGVRHIGVHFGMTGALQLIGSDGTAAGNKTGGLVFRLMATSGSDANKNSNNGGPSNKNSSKSRKRGPLKWGEKVGSWASGVVDAGSST